MRTLAILLLVSIATCLQAQENIFSRTLPENAIPENSRLKNEIKSHYVSSRYVWQEEFLKPADLTITLSPDLVVRSKFIRVHSYPAGSFSYEGKIEGSVSGGVTFSKFNDRIAGMILLEDGRKFMIDQLETNLYAVSLSQEDIFTQREKTPDFIEVSGMEEDPLPTAATTSVCDASSACPGPSVIDLMVVYTQQAENNWGGASNTVANITQAVTNMNVSMTNSGISNVSFRLAHTEKVTYTESGNFSTDLMRLAGTSDGYMDNVHTLRNQYGADLVSLIIGSPTSSCGIGYLNTSPTAYSANNGFNVSLYSCVVGNFTMAHECGHNMGLRHDWYVDGNSTPCSHHHGYVNQTAVLQGTSSPSSSRWRTIMAYNDQCSNAGFSCTRINHWSNPSVLYNNDPTGINIGNPQPSHEAYAYYRMACVVAAFRQEPAACPAPTNLSTTSVTTTSATLNWSSVSAALHYDVDYKQASSGTWINAATATTSLSVNLSGLSSSTLYDWRVRANCSGESSSYSTAQFTTSTPPAPCPGPYDISSNGSTGGAALIPLNTDIKGTISPRGDNDYYGFSITTGGSITVSLTTLPANYQLALLNSTGTQIAISQNNGTASESITTTVTAGTYYARVFPKGNASNANSCYTLRVQTGTASRSASDILVSRTFRVTLFPNPAGHQLNVWIEAEKEKTEIRIYNLSGKLVMTQVAGNGLSPLNISNLPAGFYLLNVTDGIETRALKFIKE